MMRIVGVCMVVLAISASSASIDAAAQVTRNIVQGSGSGPRLVLREAVRIGSADGEHDSFGRVADVTLDRRGRVYVADDLNHRIAVFGSDGRCIANVGREGSGPGEFANPWLVRVDPADSLWVWDMAAARVSVFAPDLRFRRSFPTPPGWIVNDLAFLPGGDLLVAAFGPGEQRPLQRLRRDGSRMASLGPRLDGARLGGFEASLLGGFTAVETATIVYSNKSPYELDLYDLSGRPLLRCAGRSEWTTRPSSVVSERGGERHLQWNRYVYVSRVIAAGGGLYLNVIHDPRTNRETLDLLDRQCRLVRRTPLSEPVAIIGRSGARVVAVRSLEYDEVVVYEMSVAPR